MAGLKGGTTIAGHQATHLGNILDQIKSIDGSGSGMDADLLDGNHASAFSLSGHTHSYDNYQKWVLKVNSESTGLNIAAGNIVDIKGSGATSISRSNGVVTISSTDTNTTYSVFTSSADGLAPLSGGGTTKYLRADGTWQVPPDNNTTYSAGTGLSLSGTKFNHSNSVTAGTISDGGSARTLAFGGTFKIPSVTYDAQGHVTNTSTITLTMPANPNTNTTYSAGTGLSLSGTKFNHSNSVTAGTISDGGSARTLAFGGTFKIPSVTYDAQGHVTNTSTITLTMPTNPNTNTTYSAGTGLSLSGTKFNHSNSVTAGTISDGGSARTLAFGGTFKIPSVTYDAQGHVTSTSTITLTMPANPNTNTATAVDNILDGSNSGTAITYAPYTAQQAKLSFDTSTTDPTRSDRLNLNGYFYATQLNSMDGYKVGANTVIDSSRNFTGGTINSVPISRGGNSVVSNLAVGVYALSNNGTGARNIAVGAFSLKNNTAGEDNTAVGAFSLEHNTTGWWNTAVGSVGLCSNTTGWWNTAVGSKSLYSNTTGPNNTAVGAFSLESNTIGEDNTALGSKSLYSNTEGIWNTAVGAFSLESNTTGIWNTAVGYQSLYSNVDGGANTAIGLISLYANTSGYSNTAAGGNALGNNTEGIENTGIGAGSLCTNTTGSQNTAVGCCSLESNTTGTYNTALGCEALNYLQSGSAFDVYTNCSGVGYNSRVSGSNQVQLGSSGTTTYAYGSVQNRSDIRDKTDITDTILGLDFITRLRPVDFRWNYREDYFEEEKYEEEKLILNPDFDDTQEESDTNLKYTKHIMVKTRLKPVSKDGSKKRVRKHHGLIAQEVKVVMDELGIDFGGYQDHSIRGGDDVLSIGYAELVAPMIKAIQELKREIDALKASM